MADIVIIGSGIAGYSAAICLNQLNVDYKLITGNKSNIKGQLCMAPVVSNYPGVNVNISGYNLMDFIEKQVKNESNKNNFIYNEVLSVDFNKTPFLLNTKDTEIDCKCVIICTGKHNNKLNLENEDKLSGKGISYCAVCDGFIYKNKIVSVVGGGDSAVRNAIYLSRIAKIVHVFVRRSGLRCNRKLFESVSKVSNIVIHYNTKIIDLIGSEYLESVNVIENGVEVEYILDCVFVSIGASPNSEIFSDYLSLDESGYIITNNNCETNIKGIYAAGDIQSNTHKQAIIAAGNGYTAAMNAYNYIISSK